MIVVTEEQLAAAAPQGNSAVIRAIADASGAVFSKYGLNTRNRVLGFLSTALEESGFRTLSEDMHYTAARLVQVWPNRFPNLASAQPYAMNPEKLANYVYGGRMGNSVPGDGYLYRGRGLIQVTGRSNYALLEKETGLPFLSTPDLALDHAHLLEASCVLFVQYPRILEYCDDANFTAVWALVGSGRADGTVVNPVNHRDALQRLQRALPASLSGLAPAQPPSLPVPPTLPPAPSPVPPAPVTPPTVRLPIPDTTPAPPVVSSWWSRFVASLRSWFSA